MLGSGRLKEYHFQKVNSIHQNVELDPTKTEINVSLLFVFLSLNSFKFHIKAKNIEDDDKLYLFD